MEDAIDTLVKMFKDYAKSDSKADTLSKDELENMVNKELPFIKKGLGQGGIDELLRASDENNDEELNFEEFWTMVGKQIILYKF